MGAASEASYCSSRLLVSRSLRMDSCLPGSCWWGAAASSPKLKSLRLLSLPLSSPSAYSSCWLLLPWLAGWACVWVRAGAGALPSSLAASGLPNTLNWPMPACWACCALGEALWLALPGGAAPLWPPCEGLGGCWGLASLLRLLVRRLSMPSEPQSRS
jgi:hypothetical protein